jgi:ABC-2 type transport system ATP-binding protein
VDHVTTEGHVFRITTHHAPDTTRAVLEAADASGVTIQSLGVTSVTLDDVFLHFTGRQLRDELQAPSAADSPFVMRR